MDNLDALPLKEDTNPNSHEEEVMGKFFSQVPQQREPPRGPQQGPPPQGPSQGEINPGGSNKTERINLKLAGYTTVLFLALANPWLDTLLCNVPYCGDNAFMLLGMKALVFALLYVIVSIFFG